jgi:hypothetical protein
MFGRPELSIYVLDHLASLIAHRPVGMTRALYILFPGDSMGYEAREMQSGAEKKPRM